MRGEPPDPYPPSVFHIRQQAVFPPFPTGWHGSAQGVCPLLPVQQVVFQARTLGLCTTFSATSRPVPHRTGQWTAINCARRFPCGVSPKTCIPSSICSIAEKAESRMDTGGKGGEVGGRFRRDLRFQIGGSDAFPDQVFQLVRPVGIPGASPVPIPQAGDPALPVRRRGRSAP